MTKYSIMLDTWLRTFALDPKGFGQWFEILKGLEVFKSVTFTLEPSENTTGLPLSITINTDEIHSTNQE
jgi:hypothetical protein